MTKLPFTKVNNYVDTIFKPYRQLSLLLFNLNQSKVAATVAGKSRVVSLYRILR